MPYEDDPIVNVIHNGIKEPIRLLVDHRHFAAAMKLVYSGIDTMAFLGMPANQDEVGAADFIAWCDDYLRLPGTEQLTGEEHYGARCGLLHTHSGVSRRSRQGRARMFQFVDEMDPPVRFEPSVTYELVVVSTRAMVGAFFAGVDRSLIAVFSDPERARAANERFANMFHQWQMPGSAVPEKV